MAVKKKRKTGFPMFMRTRPQLPSSEYIIFDYLLVTSNNKGQRNFGRQREKEGSSSSLWAMQRTTTGCLLKLNRKGCYLVTLCQKIAGVSFFTPVSETGCLSRPLSDYTESIQYLFYRSFPII